MLREAGVILLLLTVPLAGCLNPMPDETGGEAVVEAALAPTGTVDDWFVVNVTAGPDAELTSFWWTVPEGAVVMDGYWGEYATSTLEVAPLLPEGRALTEWGLLSFQKDAGKLAPRGFHLATPFHEQAEGLLMESQERTSEVRSDPFFMRLGFSDIRVGDRFGFVLAARSDEPFAFQLAFRPLDFDPIYPSEPAADAEGFLASVAPRPPLHVPVAGQGAGLQLAAYLEVNGALGPFYYHYLGWTDAVRIEGQVDPDLRPFAGQRDLTFSAAFDRAGWSLGGGVYWPQDAAGSWSVDADLHGAAVRASAPIVQSWTAWPATLGAVLLVGMPFYSAMGEGESKATSTYHVEALSAQVDGFELLAFEQFDLGATLEDLLGTPGETDAWAYTGLLSERSLRLDGGDLTSFEPGGIHVTWQDLTPGR